MYQFPVGDQACEVRAIHTIDSIRNRASPTCWFRVLFMARTELVTFSKIFAGRNVHKKSKLKHSTLPGLRICASQWMGLLVNSLT